MNYTIVWTEEAHSDFSMDYGKDGNMYYICISDKKSRIIKSRKFDNQEDAVRIFLALTNVVCRGLCNFDDRVKILMGGEIK